MYQSMHQGLSDSTSEDLFFLQLTRKLICPDSRGPSLPFKSFLLLNLLFLQFLLACFHAARKILVNFAIFVTFAAFFAFFTFEVFFFC